MLKRSRKLIAIVLLLVMSCYAVPLTVAGSNENAAVMQGVSGTDVKVVVSQAGYSKEDMKIGSVVSSRHLQDAVYEVLRNDDTVVYSGTLNYVGKTWGDHVYTFDFSSYQSIGEGFYVRSNGIESHRFSIEDNIWLRYRDEMTAFYRSLRASVDTLEALPVGYTDTPLSPKAYHEAGHLDDAWDKNNVFEQYDITLMDGTRPAPGQHYDLVGGHYDAGDYGKYGGNQWVGGQLALSYLRHSDSPAVQFDYDNNGIPDIIEEVRVAVEYLLKFVEHFDGALFDIPEKGGFTHPKNTTDGLILSPAGNPDDRTLGRLSVGGSAKAAGVMAAAARAYTVWKDNNQIDNVEVDDFIDRAEAGAVQAYEFVLANEDKHHGGYHTNSDTTNPLLWAEVQLYLLTGESKYYNSATQRIALLDASVLLSTNYWDVRPIAMADFYPVADASTQTKIQQLLKTKINYFISSADDTPYGVLNEFSNFGVNEPHVSYVGDLIRYYELFGDPQVLSAAKKGLYWVFGNNPWNISWVSGIGEKHVAFLHSRYDTDAYSAANEGIIIPGAMVSGPNMKNPTDQTSPVSPWYEDRNMAEDGVHQWRYNEFSISIQAGLFYSIMALSALDEPSTVYPNTPQMPVLSPQIGDRVTGDVNIIVASETGVSNVKLNGENMLSAGDAWLSTLNVDSTRPYGDRRVRATGSWNGETVTSSSHFTVAPPLPSPQQTSLYDDFDRNGIWGAQNLAWMNWWTQGSNPPNTTDGAFVRETVDGRAVGKFTHHPSSPQAQAKFQPWHYKVDWSGYRYLYVTLKNSGIHPGLQFKVQVNARDVHGGYTQVSDEWTTLKIDLDQIPNLNKKEAELTFWLRGGSQSGDVYIDEIYVGNEASGSAPVLSDVTVSASQGDEHTVFHYAVTYTDADNDLPYAVQLVVDGVVREMIEADKTDSDSTDGKQYIWSGSLVRGPHQFYIRTTDTHTDVVVTAVQSGPVVSAAPTAAAEPTAPGNLHLVAKTSSSLSLAWSPSEDDRGIDAYGIYRDGVLIDTVLRDQHQYEASGLDSLTSYSFAIKGHSLAQPAAVTAPSNTITAQTAEHVIEAARFLGQYAIGANERKTALQWPGNANDTPQGWGKKWQGAGNMRWAVHFPETGFYDFTLRAYGEGSSAAFQLRIDGQPVTGTESLTSNWIDYDGSLGMVVAGVYMVEVFNRSTVTNNNVNIAHLDIYGAAPGSFTLKSPADQSSVGTSSVTLDWTQEIGGRSYAPFGANEYTVVVADNAALANPLVQTTVTDSTYVLSQLQAGTTYYWSIAARNANGETWADEAFSFTTPAEVPGA